MSVEAALLKEMTLENLAEFPEGRQILTCIQCGMCAGTCPYGDVLDYPPRRIIGMLRAGLVEEVLADDSMLTCVTCHACMAKCPRDIKLTEVLLPLMKERMFMNLTEVPADLQKALEDLQRYGNTLGVSPRLRGEWTSSSDVPVRILRDDPGPVDILWFLESYASYHPRGQDASLAIARIFNALGVDFAILGKEEVSAGEAVRLLGETGLFEVLAEKNMKTFGKYKFNRLITSGAHAYDAFKHMYPAFGFNHPVNHVTLFLAEQLESLKPILTRKLNRKVTYHDSCVLGRHNGFYEEPRTLLKAIPGVELVEMTHNRVNSICCGGGGGGMWLDTYYKSKGYERLSDRRVREAIEVGADILAVSCPYEVTRFEDSLKLSGYGDKILVKDVVELIDEAMDV